MTERGMEHMKFLDAVAAEDVRELQRKEATYQGSWKRRGGVGAYMMLARKIDRLEEIMYSTLPPNRWDIFAHLETRPDGDDGTALAEVRDLRRYLLLIEAEMVARGVVALKPPELGDYSALEGRVLSHIVETGFYDNLARELGVQRGAVKTAMLKLLYGGQSQAPAETTLTESPTFAQLKEEELARIHEGTGRVARPSGPLHPAASPARRDTIAEVTEDRRPIPLGDAHDQDGIVDLPFARAGKLPKRVVSIGPTVEDAERSDRVWAIVDRAAVEDDEILLHLPRLRREMNTSEMKDLAPYYVHMYRWNDGRQTHEIKPVYERWVKTGH